MKCQQCGAENPDGARFCQNCGASTEPQVRHCTACGTPNDAGAKFCLACGKPLVSVAAETAATQNSPAPRSAPAPSPVATPPPAPRGSPLKRLIAVGFWLLALVFALLIVTQLPSSIEVSSCELAIGSADAYKCTKAPNQDVLVGAILAAIVVGGVFWREGRKR